MKTMNKKGLLMKRTRMNLKICLFILPITIACTDIGLEESTGSMPYSGKFNADPVVSIRAEQSPDNVWNLTFTYDENGSAEKDVRRLCQGIFRSKRCRVRTSPCSVLQVRVRGLYRCPERFRKKSSEQIDNLLEEYPRQCP